MTITDALADFQIGVATASLGMAASHTLGAKFAALQAAGFTYCALGFAEYMTWVRSEIPDLPASTCPVEWSEGGEPDPSDTVIWETMYAKAPAMVSLAASFGLRILVLQPLNQFDGYAPGERAEWVRRKAERWLPLCGALGVEYLQVGSNDYKDATADLDIAAADLRWLADLGAKHKVKIAYEMWCFSWRVPDVETAWAIVHKANHPNLGLCYDTAHPPLAPAYGWDPLTGSGWTDKEFAGLMHRVRRIPGDKIFYVEISDCLEPTTPLGQSSEFDEWRVKTNSPRGDAFVWAICARSVPLVGRHAGKGVRGPDDLGAARVVEQLRTVLATGFKGPIMFEFFEALRMEQDDPAVPVEYALACKESERLIREALME